MKSLASRDNPRYKALRKLAASAAARRAARRTLLEGVNLCATYLERIGPPITCVVAAAALETAAITALTAQVAPADVLVLSDALYRSISQLEQGLGVVFVIDIPEVPLPDRLASLAVLLDRLQDPGNLGSILRSAAASGIGAVYCGKGCVSAWSPKVLRAGMGAHFFVSIREECALEALVRAAAIPVMAASSHASQSLYEADLSGPIAWVFGNEGQGVADALLESATTVAIPQPGGLESLNVAAAAAVCLFEGVRQRQAAR